MNNDMTFSGNLNFTCNTFEDAYLWFAGTLTDNI